MSTVQAHTPLLIELHPNLTETKAYRELTLENLAGRIQGTIGKTGVRLIRHPEIIGNRIAVARPHTLIYDPATKTCSPAPDETMIEGTELAGSFMYMLSNAHSHHQSISIAPHDLWYVMLSEIARAVEAAPETYRAIYTKSPEKIDIKVPTSEVTILPLECIIAELTRLVPVDFSLFLPDFTTHSDNSRVASMAAFADAAKSFYNYMTFSCGIKAVELRGTKNDWEMFTSQAGDLRKAFSKAGIPENVLNWLSGIKERSLLIGECLKGGDTSFFCKMFSSQSIGSGGELSVDGWFGREFFMKAGPHKIENYPNTWSLVPFTNLDTGRKFTDAFGCFYATVEEGGMRTPQYGRYTFEHVTASLDK
jgi:Domain of unknown function (DUF4419)